jgi:hypothetical protein
MGIEYGFGFFMCLRAIFIRVFMKLTVLLAIVIALISSAAFAGPDLFCSYYHSKRVVKIATEHSEYDKNRHCSVSCMLALKCNNQEVMMVGVLKEIQDVFGPGEADAEDLKADAFGISLVSSRAAKTDLQCLTQCDLYYHE